MRARLWCISRRTICAVSLIRAQAVRARGNPAKKLSAARAISVMRDRVTHLIELITLSLSFIKYISRKFAAARDKLAFTHNWRRFTENKTCALSLDISDCVYINTRMRDAERAPGNFHRRGMPRMLCAAFYAYYRSGWLTLLSVTN